jgi:hypothetical protein
MESKEFLEQPPGISSEFKIVNVERITTSEKIIHISRVSVQRTSVLFKLYNLMTAKN